MKKCKRIWIIGGSSGIGLELVKILLKKENCLIVSSRNATQNDELRNLQKIYPNSLAMIDLDVTKDNFSQQIEEAWATYYGLDIWFYNAASYEVMDITQWDKEKFIQMNHTNYLGAVKIMSDLSPYFLKQGFGKWIWNLSLSSIFGLPKGGAYSAPKAALLNLAQAIQPELKNNGIHLQVINHGFVKTRLTSKNKFEMPQLMSKEYAAKMISNKMFKDKFEITFPFKLTLFLKFLAILPYKLSLMITRKTL